MNHEIYLVSNEDGVLMDYLKSLNDDEYQILIDSSTYMDYYVRAHQAISILNENTINLIGLIAGISSDDKNRTTFHTPF